jgi:hypothetical protein
MKAINKVLGICGVALVTAMMVSSPVARAEELGKNPKKCGPQSDNDMKKTDCDKLQGDAKENCKAGASKAPATKTAK